MHRAVEGARSPGKRAVVSVVWALLPLFFFPTVMADGARSHSRVSGEVEGRVRDASPGDAIPLIIQTENEPTSSHIARMHGRGGVMRALHSAIRGYSATLPAAQVMALSEDPEVERISFDSPVRATLDVASLAARADVALANSGGLDGSGVGIALIDTGVELHPDLERARRNEQVIEVEVVGHEKGMADYFGHGTHVAGVINGNGAASSGPDAFRTFKGLAPGATLISIRALNPDGTGRTSDVIAAIDWAIRHRRGSNIRVLNLSLGHPIEESYTTDPLCRAVRAAAEAGIVVVVSAGNGGRLGSGFGTITSPGNEPSAITVGAMDDSDTAAREDDVLAPYSSKGPTLIDHVAKPDLVAPGSFIVSLRAPGSHLEAQYPQGVLKLGDYKDAGNRATEDGAYFTLSGTSLAAPMVAATAALMLQQEPHLSPAAVKARLMASASKDDWTPFETGAGYLDVAGALEATGEAASALSPVARVAEDGSVVFEEIEPAWGAGWHQDLIWGRDRKAMTRAMTENDQVTHEGLVWSGGPAYGVETFGLVDALGLVWSGGL